MKPQTKTATLICTRLAKIRISILMVMLLEIETMIHAYYIPSTLNGVEIMIQLNSDLERCAAHVMVAKNAMIHHRNLRTLYKL